jgi:hypothetical protein
MGKVICPHCGAENPSSGILTLCRTCGQSLTTQPSGGKPSLWEPPSADGEDVEPPAQPLVPPPRHVPVGLRLVVFSGGTVGFIGWFFLGFGMIFVWVFGPRHLPLWALAWAGTPASAPGVVGESRPVNMTENGAQVYGVTYSFVTPGGDEHHGVSYVTGRNLPAGAPATVEYVRRWPEVSQIRGMRRNLLPEWVILFVLIFPGIGLAFVAGTVALGIKANRLLAHGQLACGTLTDRSPTGTRINSRMVYKLTFEFEAGDGRSYQATAKTAEPERLEDERREPLLYDVTRPAYSVMLDSLPGSPTIDPFGQLEAPPSGRVVGGLLIPGLAIVGHGTYLLARLFR